MAEASSGRPFQPETLARRAPSFAFQRVAVARTTTFALNNVTLSFTLVLADKGWKQTRHDDVHLRNGLNVHDGKIYCRPMAEAHAMPLADIKTLQS